MAETVFRLATPRREDYQLSLNAQGHGQGRVVAFEQPACVVLGRRAWRSHVLLDCQSLMLPVLE